MEVILLEKVDNLGNMGELVKVRSGYGRNYLLPKGKAALATADNLKVFEARRAELEKKQAEDLVAAQARAAELGELKLEIVSKAGTEGKLFGSIGTIDIAEACTVAGVTVQRSEVRLPNGPIRLLGEHEIELHLHTDVTTSLRLQVVGEDGAKGPSLAAAAAAAEAAAVAKAAADADVQPQPDAEADTAGTPDADNPEADDGA